MNLLDHGDSLIPKERKKAFLLFDKKCFVFSNNYYNYYVINGTFFSVFLNCVHSVYHLTSCIVGSKRLTQL